MYDIKSSPLIDHNLIDIKNTDYWLNSVSHFVLQCEKNIEDYSPTKFSKVREKYSSWFEKIDVLMKIFSLTVCMNYSSTKINTSPFS